ncbi:hypothetical protein MPER_02312 [Moniliophthora perniciosa FA553]|nr:hypothetical protein MPER_02312 [Moniliophthora perniciosa FA553]
MAGRVIDILNAVIAIGQHAEEHLSDGPDSETAAALAPEQTVWSTEGTSTFPNGCDRPAGRGATMSPRTANLGTPVVPGDIHTPGVTTTPGQYTLGDETFVHDIMGGTTTDDHNIFQSSSPVYHDYFSSMQLPDALGIPLDNTDPR